MLFKEAMGEEIPVGIIACENREYDPKRWWKTSSGVRTVLDETIAYIYAKLLFNPERDILGKRLRDLALVNGPTQYYPSVTIGRVA